MLKISVRLISSLILGFSLIISAFILKDTVTGEEQNTPMKDAKSQLPIVIKTDVMTIKQLSEYLQVSKESVESIMKKDKIEKRNITGGGYDTYQFLPYFEVGGQVRFLKSEIDKWILYQNGQSV